MVDKIAIIIAIYVIPLLFGTFLSSKFITKIGALNTMRFGLFLLLTSYISYNFTQFSYYPVMISRIMQGIGYGIYFSAVMFYAKSRLTEKSKIYFFGIFTSTIPLANFIGPASIKIVYNLINRKNVFLIHSVFAIIGFITTLFLSKDDIKEKALNNIKTSLTSIFKNKNIFYPLVIILIHGLLFGFIPSFMSMFLEEKSIHVGFFFPAFSGGLFLVRFIFMKYLQKINFKVLTFKGILLISTAYFIIIFYTRPITVLLSGIIIGFGFSFMYPVLGVQITKIVNENESSKAMSIFNFFFQIGIYGSPFIGKFIIKKWELTGMIYFLVIIGFLTTAVLSVMFIANRIKIIQNKKTVSCED